MLINEELKYFANDIQDLRDIVYNDELKQFIPEKYNGEITPTIEELLDQTYRLTKLYKALDGQNTNFDKHIQPFNDTNQPLRCYISDTYIVVEINTNSKKAGGNWTHIIEHHSADVKFEDRNRINLKIIPGLCDDEFLTKISEAVEWVIETIEQQLFDIVNNTQTKFNVIKEIRVGTVESLDNKEKEIKKHKKRFFWQKWFSQSTIHFS